MTKMPEKEEEQKLCDQFEDKLYVKMKEFLEEDDTREYIVGKFNQINEAQFEILRGEELKNDFSKAQEIVINEVTRTTEDEQCQK